MKIVVFGLTISSSWGNGHATLWRGLCRALAARGHRVVFFERDVPYYATNRDLPRAAGRRARALPRLGRVRAARRAARSPTPTSRWSRPTAPTRSPATDLVLDAPRAVRVFYDLDTPVTLSRLDAARAVAISARAGLRRFRPRAQLHRRRGARRACARSSARAASRRSTGTSTRRPSSGRRRWPASRRPVLSRHLRGRPAGGARGAVRRRRRGGGPSGAS